MQNNVYSHTKGVTNGDCKMAIYDSKLDQIAHKKYNRPQTETITYYVSMLIREKTCWDLGVNAIFLLSFQFNAGLIHIPYNI